MQRDVQVISSFPHKELTFKLLCDIFYTFISYYLLSMEQLKVNLQFNKPMIGQTHRIWDFSIFEWSIVGLITANMDLRRINSDILDNLGEKST